MIGIYKIQNLINGKIYIGQSNNIIRRFGEHKTRGASGDIPVDIAIQLYGKESFSFEMVEETSPQELNERETFWIRYYNSNEKGYNCSLDGDFQSVGTNNGRAKVSEEDVKQIRIAYSTHKRRKEVYENYKEKISFGTFASIWDGSQWSHIMPEVFTEENRRYYSREATNGELSSMAKFSNEEVLKIRTRYQTESAKQIYQDFQDRCSFQTFQCILWGRTYKNVPVYKKQQKKWIS